MITRTTLFIGAALLAGSAQAALIDRGGGLIYDDVLNVTWLQDANYGAASSFDNGVSTSDGRMTWDNAVAWAASLNYFDSVRNVTYSDWRLPTLIDTDTPGCNYAFSGTDCGYNVDTATGEMAHLFFDDLGNKSYYNTSGIGPQEGYGLANTGPFINFQNSGYWYGTVYAAEGSGNAATFDFSIGYQDPGTKAGNWSALAVRDGDVAAAAIPEPSTYALFLAGLGLVGFMARRKQAVMFEAKESPNGSQLIFPDWLQMGDAACIKNSKVPWISCSNGFSLFTLNPDTGAR